MSTLQADVLVGQRLLQHRHKGHLVSKLLVLIHDIVGVCTGLDKGRGAWAGSSLVACCAQVVSRDFTPQLLSTQRAKLRKEGVHVFDSYVTAARLALEVNTHAPHSTHHTHKHVATDTGRLHLAEVCQSRRSTGPRGVASNTLSPPNLP